MPMSEAWRDAPQALRRVRFAGFSDSVCGVAFVGGVAQAGMPAHVVARLRGIGLAIEDIGEWSTDPTTPETTSPVLELPPSADAGDVEPLPDSGASVAPESPPDAPAEPDAGADAASPADAAPKTRKPQR